MAEFGVVIVGAGQGGAPLAGALSAAGRKVALVERAHVGGTCVNEGCTPTKTMVASARVAHVVRRAAHYGVHVGQGDNKGNGEGNDKNSGEVRVDLGRVRERKREIVAMFREGSERGVRGKENLTFIEGAATFTGAKTLSVALNEGGTRDLTAETVVINVGQRPNIPPIEGLDKVPYLTSTSVMELGEVPGHLIVLGGGYIGLEFAQMFRRFGAEVTVVQRSSQLMPREDADVAETLTDILLEDGVTILLNSAAQRVSQENGQISLTYTDGQGERTVQGSHLLVATGRKSNSDTLGLDAAGVRVDQRGNIEVSGNLETSVPGVYAIGDVKGGPAFTHIAYDDFRILRDNLLNGAGRTIDGRTVPYSLFTDPQLGRVGLSEKEAREAGYTIKVAKMPLSYAARALEIDETRGLLKAVVDADTDKILGAAILSFDGGEVMTIIQTAMLGGMPYQVLRDSPFAHPTLAESLNNLFGSFA